MSKHSVKEGPIPGVQSRALALNNSVALSKEGPEYVRYTPSHLTPGYNHACAQRLVRIVDAQVDPLEPPKFRHRRAPGAPPSPPPPILRSPPRKLTKDDEAQWRIPPCISNWKNQRGYTVPLDKRIQADGRTLQESAIVVDKFASLSEALYIAERTAREEIRLRNDLLKQKKHLEEQQREQRLREMAAQARAQKSRLVSKGSEMQRDAEREVEREVRLQRRSKKSRDEERDISEKVALGQARPSAASEAGGFDSRLYNRSEGLSHGFDGEVIYDAPLFADRSAAQEYRYDPERMRRNAGLGADDVEDTGPRTKPVAFEKDEADPFGLDALISNRIKRRKGA